MPQFRAEAAPQYAQPSPVLQPFPPAQQPPAQPAPAPSAVPWGAGVAVDHAGQPQAPGGWPAHVPAPVGFAVPQPAPAQQPPQQQAPAPQAPPMPVQPMPGAIHGQPPVGSPVLPPGF
jgi:hypothetical protein